MLAFFYIIKQCCILTVYIASASNIMNTNCYSAEIIYGDLDGY